MTNKLKNNKKVGFTLVEMMVSLALFTIVSTVTVGALLSLIGGNQRLVKQQTLASSAIFSLDNMTREIRTGNYYNCRSGNFSTQNTYGNSVQDCASGATGISFIELSTRATSGGRVAYYFDDGSLWRRIGNNPVAEKLLPDDVLIDSTLSRFFVTGSQTLTDGDINTDQPAVTIIMVLEETEETDSLTLQTTITQRSLDI